MTFFESLKIALRALQTNKLRSFLTMLGIIVGVASVVSMVAFAAGAQREISRQIRTLGANILMIEPRDLEATNEQASRSRPSRLSEDDADEIEYRIEAVAIAAPSVRGNASVVHKNKNSWMMVNGTTSDYFQIREWPLSSGRFFSTSEQATAGKVALIGQLTATRFFGVEDPRGQTIRVNSVPLEVIGVLAEKGSSGYGQTQDDIVFLPISTAKRRLIGSANTLHRGSVNYILVKANSSESIGEAEQGITTLLKRLHRISPDKEVDFRVIDPKTAMEAQHAAKKTIGWLLAGIASVSLIVGGISIMNIMLVSVTERTREIGLRMAIGARARDVQFQFLMEAVLLCFLGGLIGLAIGGGAAYAVGRLAGWPIYLSPISVIGAVGLASLVGLLFGFFPARWAAQLEPIKALRVE